MFAGRAADVCRPLQLLEVPDESDATARNWMIPDGIDANGEQIADDAGAILELNRAMCHNLRNVLKRPSTVQATTWFDLDTRSVLAPDGDTRLTVLKWDHDDRTGALPPYRSRYAVASGSSQTGLAFDDYLLDNLGVLTPRACLLAPDPESVKPETGGCAGGGTVPTGPTPTEAELIAAHNQFRAAHGLGALAQNAQLTAAIAGHLAWLKAENSGISHTGDGGSQPLDRAIAAGYEGAGATSAGENLALGHATVALVMAAWENSPAHYANLVHADWADIGVAILPIDDAAGFWWGALFGDRT
ncbi:CAP domain-containing protein [Thiocystis violascens]|uniref:Cysteine-rich secretory protein family n=1 Tax=Thiocystis violascens (strain ATCC 17096 / DSM 198 / 6111) TaxID=765911 RepID=I3Y8N8_THIV6|nr:CAP domain-containing protein [Thiocystis violascens]AFL73356.1 Cysteine-rich secretory protein family [Thiocystis violascens DSM 198]